MVGSRRLRERTGRLWLFLSLAFVVHIVGIPLVAPSLFELNEPTVKATKVRLVTVDGNVVHPYRGRNPLRPTSTEAERIRAQQEEARRAAEKKKPETVGGQVVELPPSPDRRAPDNARYLSEHNSRTEHETRSRHQTKDYVNAMNERTVTSKSELASRDDPHDATALEVGPERPAQPGASKAASPFALEIPSTTKRDRLALAFDPKSGRFRNQTESQAMTGNSNRLKLSVGEPGTKDGAKGSAPKQGLTMSDLVPAVGVMARVAGAPANDHLEGLDEGEGTFLNSREFKFASYFNRMKRGVSQHWDPISEYRRRDPTGNIYGFRARVTVVNVTLDRDGALKDVEVTQTSGIDFLDREAISAFRRAAPFPNPPRALVGDGGNFTFPFGFHVEFSEHGGIELPF
ncbi:MAG: energy transducer TonB [Deltaproteobacteria bacterium]|nr:energy transducer TonB [Deltaproteobacteria bacterium]